jgi:photosystem II stability/assembly factor-like uncharacterized protein
MKTIYLFAFLFPATLAAQWNTLPSAGNGTVTDMSFPSDDTGYLASASIHRTFNGGVSFDSVSAPGMTQYSSVHFRTNTEGAICGYATSGVSVQRTFNSGLTWVDVTPDSIGGNPLAVQFSGPLKGVFLTSYIGFYITTDGGLTWDTINFGYDFFNTVDFADSQTGYIGGFDGTFAYRGVIAKTTDGGATWNVITNLTAWNTTIERIKFVNADTGFASYNAFSQPSKIIRTLNGGSSWDTIVFNHGQLFDFAFSNADNGFVVNDSGSIYRTFDGGISWLLDRASSGVYLFNIEVTPAFAYASGNSGLALKRNLATNIFENSAHFNVALYPNPAGEFTSVALPETFEVRTVTAFDAAGRSYGLIPWHNYNGNLRMETAELAPGLYLVEIAGPSGKIVARLGKI